MSGSWIAIPTPAGQSFDAYIARPTKGSGPGLVLCQEIFGVNEHMRQLAELFAEEGYVVVVPDLFWRQQPHIELGYDQAGVERAHKVASGFDDAKGVQDIAAATDMLRRDSACTGGIGLVGWCLGGRLVMAAAGAAKADCIVSYYGVGVERILEFLPSEMPPTVMHFGMDDPYVPAAAVRALGKRLNGQRVEIYEYPGVAHAFANAARASFDKPAADMAHTRTIAMLRRVLGPRYDLNALWEAHRACEFVTCDADATMQTMVGQPYVNHIPTLTGGYGFDDLHHFYQHHFIPKSPKDLKSTPISRTIGADRVVNEVVLSFTHDCEIDWMLPGVPPTNKFVEVALVGIITFRGDKLVHEHIYWDQASVLAQIGLLDPAGLPVAGADAARKVVDPSLPSNALLTGWKKSAHV